MKTLAGAAAIAALVGLTPVAAQAGGVGVSIGFNQPGLYGQVDFGPQPYRAAAYPVYVPPPRVVVAPPVVQPVVMRVPPHEQRHWHHYCHKYNACGLPVAFVQEHWRPPHPGHRHWHGHDRPAYPVAYGRWDR